ncbi:MAG: thioredoxin domain-containing protein [Patescibacteria group bacterium]
MEKKKFFLNALIYFALFTLIIFAVSVFRGCQKNDTVIRPEVSGKDPRLGEKNAKVTIIEFGDFQCPYCDELAPIFKKLKDEYKEQLTIVWKDFPLTTVHEEALSAAQAARCSQKQGKFWEMHDELFANQSLLSAELYPKLSAKIGLNTDQFIDCLNNGETLSLIQKNVNEGVALGVDGTPYFYLNNYVITELMSEESLKALITTELAK